MAIVSKIHNISYLADVKFDTSNLDAMVLEADGSYSYPLAFVPAGAVVTRVAVKTTENPTGQAVSVNVGFNDEKNLFIDNVDISAAPATSAVMFKATIDGVVALNFIGMLSTAKGEAYVEYYLPATIKTEI